MNKKTIHEIFIRFKKHNPHPTTELNYTNEFELLIAVILSAQATDVSVNKATQKLFAAANTPEKMLGLGIERLRSMIKTIGLYTRKAQHIMQTCEILCAQYHGQVPSTREALESLPGVGRKTANVVLNTAFGHSTIAVDTHIFRVANRIGLTHAATVRGVEDQLMHVIPVEYQHDAHHWLILHGRYTCVARKPKCYQCLIADLCEYPNKTPSEINHTKIEK